jgi:intein/homing endonuclease
MDVHPDRALIYSIIQGGVQAFQHAKSLGVCPEFLVSEDDKKIFVACEEVFLPKGKMPSVSNIRQHYKVDIDEPIAEFDIDLCSQEIMNRALMTRLNDGLGPIEDMIPINPVEARDALGALVKATNWSLGSVVRTNSPHAISEVKKRYLEAKSRDGGLLGLSSPWPSRDKASLGLQAGEVTVLLAKRKSGKCLSAETPITCPSTGVQFTVEEFVKDGSRKVLTWGENQPIHPVLPSAYVDTGTKECLKITWRSGRTLIATPEHPLMTPTGWQRLDALQEGRHTAAVAKLPPPTSPRDNFKRPHLTVLAFMIAEGGCTKPSTPSFTSTVPDIVGEMETALAYDRTKLTETKTPGNYYVVGDDGPNGIIRFLDRHGLMGKKSIDKEMPDIIYTLPDDLLAYFMGRLWSCDGSVEAKGVVSYSTGSRKLADAVQHLLLRFGVTSRVRTMPRKIKDGDEERDYYEVVLRKERIEAFKSTIGQHFIGPKAAKLQKVKFQGRSRVGWIRNEELWDQIKAEMEERPELVKEVGEELGYDFRFQKSHVLDYKSGRIRKKVFEAFCDVYSSDLRWVLDDNITWDEIVMVEPVGERRVFDLTVIPTHCFIANDVVVHNTWLMLKWIEHIWTAKRSDGTSELGPGDCILVVSMEMPVWQVLRRLFAIHQKLDYEKFRAGQLDEVEEKRFMDWCDDMERPDPNRPEIIVVASDRCRTVDDIVGLTAQYRPKAVFIDSFYILDASSGRMQMWERMIYNIKAIKLDIAIGFGVPVVTTTQLSGQVKKGDMNAEADAVAYAKAIGDYADAIDGIFGNTEFQGNNRRILRGMEAREYKTVDLEIHFNPGTHEYGEIKVLDSVEEGTGQSLDSSNDGGSGIDEEPFYDSETILID